MQSPQPAPQVETKYLTIAPRPDHAWMNEIPIAERSAPSNPNEGVTDGCQTIFDIPVYMEILESNQKYMLHMLDLLVQKKELMRMYDRDYKYDSLYRQIDDYATQCHRCLSSRCVSLQVVKETIAHVERCMDWLNNAVRKDFWNNLAAHNKLCVAVEQHVQNINELAKRPQSTLSNDVLPTSI